MVLCFRSYHREVSIRGAFLPASSGQARRAKKAGDKTKVLRAYLLPPPSAAPLSPTLAYLLQGKASPRHAPQATPRCCYGLGRAPCSLGLPHERYPHHYHRNKRYVPLSMDAIFKFGVQHGHLTARRPTCCRRQLQTCLQPPTSALCLHL